MRQGVNLHRTMPKAPLPLRPTLRKVNPYPRCSFLQIVVCFFSSFAFLGRSHLLFFSKPPLHVLPWTCTMSLVPSPVEAHPLIGNSKETDKSLL
jgi:hypothetical protein